MDFGSIVGPFFYDLDTILWKVGFRKWVGKMVPAPSQTGTTWRAGRLLDSPPRVRAFSNKKQQLQQQLQVFSKNCRSCWYMSVFCRGRCSMSLSFQKFVFNRSFWNMVAVSSFVFFQLMWFASNFKNKTVQRHTKCWWSDTPWAKAWRIFHLIYFWGIQKIQAVCSQT